MFRFRRSSKLARRKFHFPFGIIMLSIQIETIQTCRRCDLISKQLNSLEIRSKIKYNKIILYKCALLQKCFRIVVTFAPGLIKISSGFCSTNNCISQFTIYGTTLSSKLKVFSKCSLVYTIRFISRLKNILRST